MRSPENAGSYLERAGRVTIATCVGAVRSYNEDLVLCERDVVVVLDGLGGICAGTAAVQVAANALVDRLEVASSLADALRVASRAVEDASASKPELRGIGAAAVVARLGAGGAELAHVGDCRAYRLRAGVLEPLTRDHDLARLATDQGMPADQVAELATRHSTVITSALGMPNLAIDERKVALEAGDRLILVSDGVHRYLAAGELVRLLDGDPLVAAQAVIAWANEHGKDNASIAIVAA